MTRARARGLWALLLVALVAAAVAPGALVLAQGGTLTSRSDLVGLYALRGSLGLRARDWPRRADPCAAWAGVGCRAGRVVSLSVAGLRRTRLARLSPRFDVDGLRNLTRLEAFSAAGFGLPGSIPAWLGAGLAPTLQSLDISACAVSGEIPASALLGLGNLTTLNLAGNQLSGQLPATALPRLTRLRTLNLSRNAFSGALPHAVWSLPGLSVLDVSRNNLTGALPTPGLALPANAQVVDLSGNFFYGGVPETFRRLFAQVLLANISGNYFDGELGVSDGGGGNVSFQLNCFLDVLGQRTQVDCQQFYASRGLPYDGPVIPPAPQPAPSPVRKKHKNLKYILIGAIGGGLLLIAVVAAIVFCFVCSGSTGRRNHQRESGASPSAPSGVSATGTAAATGGTQPSALSANTVKVGDSFAYDQLVNATSGFGENRLIKHGHSGDLYHGVLQDGTAVVVKRITSRVPRKDAYLAELDLFAKGVHETLVPLLGHCLDKEEEKVLVYRFVRNGDLSNALHRKSREENEGLQSLDWIKRLKIATGVAEALCYLHHECSPPMVHRDVQASSILLDDKFDVRLGSLSKVCPQEGEGHQNVITKLLRFSSSRFFWFPICNLPI
uniref:Protein kinase domain-containing protein n=1 Tax=Zea mays TaxID=4577 RepID=A0A804P8F6_MAIZE